MVSFEKLANAVIAFVESEIIPNMTAAQEILARVAIAWVLDSGTIAVDLLAQNSWAKAFGVIDGKKNINADRALMYLGALAQKNKLVFTLPVFGRFAFGPDDIDKLRSLLTEESA